jgi:hypothetical protein
MGRESARVEESPTTPELTKGPSATGKTDECGSLGQEDGAQGALVSLNGQGLRTDHRLAAELRRRIDPVERLIRYVQEAVRLKRSYRKFGRSRLFPRWLDL